MLLQPLSFSFFLSLLLFFFFFFFSLSVFDNISMQPQFHCDTKLSTSRVVSATSDGCNGGICDFEIQTLETRSTNGVFLNQPIEEGTVLLGFYLVFCLILGFTQFLSSIHLPKSTQPDSHRHTQTWVAMEMTKAVLPGCLPSFQFYTGFYLVSWCVWRPQPDQVRRCFGTLGGVRWNRKV